MSENVFGWIVKGKTNSTRNKNHYSRNELMSRKTDGKTCGLLFVISFLSISVLLKPTCKAEIIYLGESRRIVILIRNNDSDRNFYRVA